VDGERIGKIDCMHIYHFDCIKQWLMQENICPICRHIALEIGHEEEDESQRQ
jgi:E3 ubiquitin-protein ligase Arkadia